MNQLSPMMEQYFEVKKQHRGTILFFRLGDFYEMFYDDAILVSKELDLTLTGRDCGQEKRAPMCGIPYHSCEAYIARLVKKGYKIALCDQIENPTAGKNIVKRAVTRIITPGTVMESSMLEEGVNNFISSIYTSDDKIGVCFCDISTGALYATEICDDILVKLENELSKYLPREILINSETVKLDGLSTFIREKLSCTVEMLGNEGENFSQGKAKILDHFNKKNLGELELENKECVVQSIHLLLIYLERTQKVGLKRINTVELYNETQFMRLDMNTRRNLELTETMKRKEKRGSLLSVIDKTKTAMGKRLMRAWIEQPLISCVAILKRHDAVEELTSDIMKIDALSLNLSGIYDMERLVSRVVCGLINARELRALAYTIEKLPAIKDLLRDSKSILLCNINKGIDDLQDIYERIDRTLEDDPPLAIKEGNIIKAGYSDELDQIRGNITDISSVIADVESREKSKTGIPKLKIGYNKVFGYYIEISNSYKDKVPDSYIRKQTLTNCERYITQEIKDLESKMLGSRERSIQLEYEIFEKLRTDVAAELLRIQKTAMMVANLDVLVSFAKVSLQNNYTRPIINNDGKIILKASRHPVIEEILTEVPFVPNDVCLDTNSNRIYTITGPNMAGKSTYMRQIALIVILAQIGCFVPASSAEIGIVDGVYTRIGASDDLASGQSTFMVEMSEVADILKSATVNSLIILDEIGRGTSTFDGMSIARAVLEYIADRRKIGAKALFATHYHELTVLESLISGVRNYNIAVKKCGDDITFLRKIVRGGVDDSYGIEVAKLAGLPNSVIGRAKAILKEIESTNKNICSKAVVQCEDKEEEVQISLEDNKNDEVIQRLKQIDIETLTPIESMTLLFKLIKLIS